MLMLQRSILFQQGVQFIVFVVDSLVKIGKKLLEATWRDSVTQTSYLAAGCLVRGGAS